MQRADSILVCPKTGGGILLDGENGIAETGRSDMSYPIRDGIVDFLPGVRDLISVSYDRSASRYDSYMKSGNLFWTLIRQIGWGIARTESYTAKVLSVIPDDFDGVLLDVPVGTGVLTLEKYARMKKATILSVDYSIGMLQQAKKRFEQRDIDNVIFVRGDVGSLPLRDSSVDFCVSMNGLHAFPRKVVALSEIRRVLKPDGGFAGCFYVTGKRRLTDLFVWAILSKTGSFAEPFFDEAVALSLLEKGFRISSHGNNHSIFFFEASKRQSL